MRITTTSRLDGVGNGRSLAKLHLEQRLVPGGSEYDLDLHFGCESGLEVSSTRAVDLSGPAGERIDQ